MCPRPALCPSLSFALLFLFLALLHRPLSFTVHPSGCILITGAAKGIGRHAAQHLATALGPSFLILAGVRSPADAADLSSLRLPNLLPVELDVSSDEGVRSGMEAVEAAIAQRGLPLIAVVNNAGQARGPTALEFHSAEDAVNLFQVNLFGALRVTQAALPLLRASKGRVVMVSSIFGALAPPMGGVYAASKFALEALADALRREAGALGVSVSIVMPGAVRTPIFATLAPASLAAAVRSGGPAVSAYPHLHTAADVENEALLEARAADPSVTTEAIFHALRNEAPRTRYVVANLIGVPAGVFYYLAWLLPDRAMDALLGLKY